MSRIAPLLIASSLIFCGALRAAAQFKTELVNSQGATAPCVGIGPIGGPLAKKCVDMFLQAGFLRVDDVGVTGLTVGTSGKDDGVITRVDPGSPAATSGLVVGDAIVAIEDQPVQPTPAMIATQRTFGERGDPLHMKVRRGASTVDIAIERSARTAPPGPKSPSMFISVKPLIDWRGKFIPCMGAGPAGFAAISYCTKHFRPFGYVKTGEMGSSGFQLDPTRPDNAIIGAIEPGSPAAKTDLRPGDEITAIEGQPLKASVGEAADERLFGKSGDRFRVTVHSGQLDKTVALTLAGQQKQ